MGRDAWIYIHTLRRSWELMVLHANDTGTGDGAMGGTYAWGIWGRELAGAGAVRGGRVGGRSLAGGRV